MDFIREWGAVIWALILTAFNVIQLLLAKTYARREALESITMAVEILENKVNSLPSQAEQHRLQLEMSDLRGELHALREQLKPVHNLANLLLEERLKR
ncbi:DUF2730 family protein [Alkalimonas mucilaginosa]|uniref:DUF2730 family protein n=1 Tax=Alkalimonas mucilaginosa TaxID=3057676 RepID=A0ABU7JJB0_9GAMM|nr:DUF2730 family protein [Alkalimonas sp. MEB004]MEE2025043.1 DUF2730 family protein [Alkalimonas sp. MEB004]